MIGNIFLMFIAACMTILIGYPLVKWVKAELVNREQRDKRRAQIN